MKEVRVPPCTDDADHCTNDWRGKLVCVDECMLMYVWTNDDDDDTDVYYYIGERL